jgi:hypothetical protein
MSGRVDINSLLRYPPHVLILIATREDLKYLLTHGRYLVQRKVSIRVRSGPEFGTVIERLPLYKGSQC